MCMPVAPDVLQNAGRAISSRTALAARTASTTLGNDGFERIEIEDDVVRRIQVGDRRAPDVDLDAAQVRLVEQGVPVLADEIADLLVLALGRDLHGFHPGRRRLAQVLLEEALARDAVGMPVQRLGPVLEVGEDPLRHPPVIFDQVSLGVPLPGPEDLVEMGQLRAGPEFRRLEGPPGSARPAPHDLPGALVLPQPQENGLPHEPLGGPFAELDLADQARLDPGHRHVGPRLLRERGPGS